MIPSKTPEDAKAEGRKRLLEMINKNIAEKNKLQEPPVESLKERTNIMEADMSLIQKFKNLEPKLIDRVVIFLCVLTFSIALVWSSYNISSGNRFQKLDDNMYLDKRTNKVYLLMYNEAKFLYKIPK